MADHLNFSCGLSDYETFEEAWEGSDWPGYGHTSCLVTFAEDAPGDELSDYTLTELETKIMETEAFSWELVGSDETNALVGLYSSCAQANMYNAYGSQDWTWSGAQDRFQLVSQLCPNHPNIDDLTAEAKDGAAEIAETEKGVRFDDGTHLVGDEIQPGTYAITNPGDGCYWERTDSRGEIIDNNFITSARRVEVTIQTSDYSFHSKRCGEWTAP